MNCFDYRTCIELLMQRQFLGFLFQGGLILILPLISLSVFLVLLWMEATLSDRSIYSRKTSFALRLLFLLMFLLALLPAVAYVMPSSAYWIMGIPEAVSVFQLPIQALEAIGTLVFGTTIIGGVAVIFQFAALGGLLRLALSAEPVFAAHRLPLPASAPVRTLRNLSVGQLTPVPSVGPSTNRAEKESSYDMRQANPEMDSELTRPRLGTQPDVRTSFHVGASSAPFRTAALSKGNRDDLEITLPPDFRIPDLTLTTSLDYIAWLELRYIGTQRYEGVDARWLLDGAVKVVGRKSTKSTSSNLISLSGADVTISRKQIELRPDAKAYRIKNIGQADVQVSDNQLLRDQEIVLHNGEQIAILVGKRKAYTFFYSQLSSPQLRVVHVVDGNEEIRKTDDFRFTIGGPTPSAGPTTPQPVANIYFDLMLTPPGYVIEREKMQDSREYKQIVVNGQELLNQTMPLRQGSRIAIGNHELVLQIPEPLFLQSESRTVYHVSQQAVAEITKEETFAPPTSLFLPKFDRDMTPPPFSRDASIRRSKIIGWIEQRFAKQGTTKQSLNTDILGETPKLIGRESSRIVTNIIALVDADPSVSRRHLLIIPEFENDRITGYSIQNIAKTGIKVALNGKNLSWGEEKRLVDGDEIELPSGNDQAHRLWYRQVSNPQLEINDIRTGETVTIATSDFRFDFGGEKSDVGPKSDDIYARILLDLSIDSPGFVLESNSGGPDNLMPISVDGSWVNKGQVVPLKEGSRIEYRDYEVIFRAN